MKEFQHCRLQRTNSPEHPFTLQQSLKNEIPEKYLSAISLEMAIHTKSHTFTTQKRILSPMQFDRTTLAKRNKILPNNVIRFHSVHMC